MFQGTQSSPLIPREGVSRSSRTASLRSQYFARNDRQLNHRLSAYRRHATSRTSQRQRGPDHPREIGAEVGLGQQQHAGVEPAMMHDGVFGIARRIKDLE